MQAIRQLFSDPDSRVDLTLAVAIWIVAGAVYWSATQVPPPQFDPVGSAAIPQAISITLAVIAALIVGKRLLRLRAADRGRAPEVKEDAPFDPTDTSQPLRPGIAAGAIVVLVGYVLVMSFGWLGFREATIPFVILLGGVLCRFERRTMLVLVPLAFAIALGFAWLFYDILYVDLPATRWLQ